MRVCLVDDNPSLGGQIWRSSIANKPPHPKAAHWLARIAKGGVAVRSGARVVTARTSGPRGRTVLCVEQAEQATEIETSALVLATGARERFLPFPGWTLPGVYGAGGLLAFVKAGLDIHGKRVVVAGTGPLLLAVAAGLRAAGARIVAVIEQAETRRLARFSGRLLAGHAGKVIEGARYGWRMRGIPYRTNAWVTMALGDQRLQKVIVRHGAARLEWDADMLAIGYHLVPNIELAQLLQCRIDGGFVGVDERQQTSVKGIYCVGEGTGIGGVDKAQIEGLIAGFEASGLTDRARRLRKARDRQAGLAKNLAATFALREELRILAGPETLVCRCEDVAYRVVAACQSWREAKLHTRCGMGPCQGRICGAATEFLFGWQAPAPRPPLFPADVSTLVAACHQHGDTADEAQPHR
jgi:NADPH-dependent 2,4-dienoyl-CoA reductase/sulfur reductase-like enzyme